jgi:hypothetical protein
VGEILDALLGAVAAIDADTGIGVGDGVVLRRWGSGPLFQSVARVEKSACATEPEEAFQAQQILARLESLPGFPDSMSEGAIMLIQSFVPETSMRILIVLFSLC